MTLNGRYPADVRKKAIDAVDQRRLRNPRDRTIFREVAQEFGVGEQSLRLWVKSLDARRLEAQHTASADLPDAVRLPEGASAALVEQELDSMRRQIQKLRAENDILKRAFVMFSTEWSKHEPGKD